jgi:hypothetical protein
VNFISSDLFCNCRKMGVEYLLIHVAADNKVAACRCYVAS